MSANVKIVCLLAELQRLALLQGHKGARLGIPLDKLEEWDSREDQPARSGIYNDILDEFNLRIIDIESRHQ